MSKIKRQEVWTAISARLFESHGKIATIHSKSSVTSIAECKGPYHMWVEETTDEKKAAPEDLQEMNANYDLEAQLLHDTRCRAKDETEI